MRLRLWSAIAVFAGVLLFVPAYGQDDAKKAPKDNQAPAQKAEADEPQVDFVDPRDTVKDRPHGGFGPKVSEKQKKAWDKTKKLSKQDLKKVLKRKPGSKPEPALPAPLQAQPVFAWQTLGDRVVALWQDVVSSDDDGNPIVTPTKLLELHMGRRNKIYEPYLGRDGSVYAPFATASYASGFAVAHLARGLALEVLYLGDDDDSEWVELRPQEAIPGDPMTHYLPSESAKGLGGTVAVRVHRAGVVPTARPQDYFPSDGKLRKDSPQKAKGPKAKPTNEAEAIELELKLKAKKPTSPPKEDEGTDDEAPKGDDVK